MPSVFNECNSDYFGVTDRERVIGNAFRSSFILRNYAVVYEWKYGRFITDKVVDKYHAVYPEVMHRSRSGNGERDRNIAR